MSVAEPTDVAAERAADASLVSSAERCWVSDRAESASDSGRAEGGADNSDAPDASLSKQPVWRSADDFLVEDPGNYARAVGRAADGEFDSLLGDRAAAVGTYREFITFDEGSVLPEFAVFYVREY